MLEGTGDDPGRLDRLSALAAQIQGYQLLQCAESCMPPTPVAEDAFSCPVLDKCQKVSVYHHKCSGR